MIVGKIIGGLGNQMFQYVFYKYLSKIKNVELKLDLDDFKAYSLHNGFELEEIFNVSENIVTPLEVIKFKSKFPLFFKIENKFFEQNILFGKKHFKESNYKINQKIFNDKIVDFYTEGYFQTPEYIDYFNNKNISFFNFNTELQENEKEILKENTIAIHIRGGDYIQNPKDKKLFGDICTKEYYSSAIKYIKTKVDKPKFIVFTNDLKYAETILEGEEFIFITWNSDKNSYRDMFLMTKCKHNIIANSSFSWWGAYLNMNNPKIIIAPSKWFNSNKIRQENILPLNWIKISPNGVIL